MLQWKNELLKAAQKKEKTTVNLGDSPYEPKTQAGLKKGKKKKREPRNNEIDEYNSSRQYNNNSKSSNGKTQLPPIIRPDVPAQNIIEIVEEQ